MAPADMIEKLAGDYAALGRVGLPKLTPVRVAVSSRRAGTLDEVEREIEALEAGCTGWTRRQSRATICPRKEDRAARMAHGAPLSGEWLVEAAESVELRYDGQAWRLTTIRELAADEAPEASGTTVFPCLRQTTKLLPKQETEERLSGGEPDDGVGIGRLRYAVYWGTGITGNSAPDGIGAASDVRRLFSRFIGFDHGDNGGRP